MTNSRAADGSWLDEPHMGDHLGRAVWALGEVSGAAVDSWSSGVAEQLLAAIVAARPDFTSPRSIAFALLGLAGRPGVRPSEQEALLVATLSDRLAALYRQHHTDDWPWLEDYLTYDNARMPQALLAAACRLGDAEVADLALESLEWYGEQCHVGSSAVALVGNLWSHRPGDRALGTVAGRDEGCGAQ